MPHGMAPVPGGTLPETSKLGPVRVDPFYLGRYEVTWNEWQAVRAWAVEHGYDLSRAGRGSAGRHPVHSVTWYEALKWCNAKSEMEDLAPVYTDARGATYRNGMLVPRINASANGYRLPTEAEWEWAARGGVTGQDHPYSGSHEVDAVAWYFGNSSGAAMSLDNGRGTWPVGRKAANELGFHDMSGNVSEWCWEEVASSGAVPLRGGGWNSKAGQCTVFDRSGSTFPENQHPAIGFRIALSAPDVDHTRMLGLFGDLAFGEVAVGAEATRPLTLHNYASEELSVTALVYPPGFSGDGTGGTIPAGGSRQIAVTFAPLAAQAYSGRLTAISAAAGSWTKELSGTGVNPVQGGMVVVQGGTLPEASQLAGWTVEPFYLGQHEVTWKEWDAVRLYAVANGYDVLAGQGTAGNHPVRQVNWYDAVKWCNAKSEMEGLTPVYTVGGQTYKTGETVPGRNTDADGYRLPTEAEWEWAARGGVQSQGYTYSGSDDLDAVAWYRDNSSGAEAGLSYGGGGTWPVGQKAPNELGLYDMSGNISEWCWDEAHGGATRSHRGGNWHFQPHDCTVSQRGGFNPANRADYFGLRLARNHRLEPEGMVGVEGGALPPASHLGPVRVDPFYLSRFEVTWDEWQAVRAWAANHGYDLHEVGQASAGNHPVRSVNWYDVLKWCNAKSEMEGLIPVYTANGATYRNGETVPNADPIADGYRLPTEAEWEWAARGGVHSQGYIYSGSDDPDEVAWYFGNNSPSGTKPVGTKAANELGLHDMSGNVWEWCWDAGWDDDGSVFRRVRGGGWVSGTTGCTVAFRFHHPPADRGANLGFRPARHRTPDGMAVVQGGLLPPSSWLFGQTVESFYLNRHEITWREWQQVRSWAVANGYDLHNVGRGSADDHPVRNVSWYDAVKWCNAKSEMEDLIPVYRAGGAIYRSGQHVPAADTGANGYRLPTEAEWEWAAQGGVHSEGYTYSGSDNLDEVAWYSGNASGAAVNLSSGRGTWPVGQKAANELGLHDMSGNVLEWCWDAGGGWDAAAGLPYRRMRGGSFLHYESHCTVAERLDIDHGPSNRLSSFGFRPARSQVRRSMATVQGGRLPTSSPLAGQSVASFSIGRHEVTWEEWRQVRAWAVDHGYDLEGIGAGLAENHPVHSVSWHDAVKWCNAKSEMEELTPVYQVHGQVYRTATSQPAVDLFADGYRLPTEAEWEWAARGGVQSQGYTYSGSNDLDEVAWYWTGASLPSASQTKAVGLKAANELGLHDMTGNVWEWCWNEWSSAAPDFRVLRGASWSTSDINDNCAVAVRHHAAVDDRAAHVGFRLARNGPAPEGMLGVRGGTMPSCSPLAGETIAPLFVGRHEVTWDEWQQVRSWAMHNGYSFATGEGSAGDHPVQNVNWFDVAKWCNAKSEMEGLTPVYSVEIRQYPDAPGTYETSTMEIFRIHEYGHLTSSQNWYTTTGSWNDPPATIVFHMDPSADGYRLPTSLEWEWAARGGELSQCHTYSGSDDLDAVAWYQDNSSGAAVDLELGMNLPHLPWLPPHQARGTWPVGQKLPNELGLYDMSGNVSEWVWDRIPIAVKNRILRGGSWYSPEEHCELSYPHPHGLAPIPMHHRHPAMGFRTVRHVGE